VKGSVKSTGTVITPIFCTIVTLQPVVMTSETRKEEKTAKERNVQERELRGAGFVKPIFLTTQLSITVTRAL